MSETLEQYADRIVAATRKRLLDKLDDDVIGCLGESHLIFGRACAVEAIATAMRESAALSTPPIQSGEHPRPDDVERVAGAIADAGGSSNWSHALECARAAPSAIQSRDAGLREALDDLQNAERTYRYAHDIFGGGDSKTGRAWDLMRRAGDKARAVLGKGGDQ